MLQGCCVGIGFVLLLALPGVLVALVARVPPLRHAAQASPATRRSLIATLGMLAFVLTYALVAALMAFMVVEWVGIFRNLSQPSTSSFDYQGRKDAIAVEVWVRTLVPFGATQRCYSGDAQVCERTDALIDEYDALTSGGSSFRSEDFYGVVIIPALLAMGLCMGLAWHATRRPPPAPITSPPPDMLAGDAAPESSDAVQ